MQKKMQAQDILGAYGAEVNEQTDRLDIEVQHPQSGRWYPTSGGMRDGDVVTLALFTGTIKKMYDEYGGHDVPSYTAGASAIHVRADEWLTVRNAR